MTIEFAGTTVRHTDGRSPIYIRSKKGNKSEMRSVRTCSSSCSLDMVLPGNLSGLTLMDRIKKIGTEFIHHISIYTDSFLKGIDGMSQYDKQKIMYNQTTFYLHEIRIVVGGYHQDITTVTSEERKEQVEVQMIFSARSEAEIRDDSDPGAIVVIGLRGIRDNFGSVSAMSHQLTDLAGVLGNEFANNHAGLETTTVNDMGEIKRMKFAAPLLSLSEWIPEDTGFYTYVGEIDYYAGSTLHHLRKPCIHVVMSEIQSITNRFFTDIEKVLGSEVGHGFYLAPEPSLSTSETVVSYNPYAFNRFRTNLDTSILPEDRLVPNWRVLPTHPIESQGNITILKNKLSTAWDHGKLKYLSIPGTLIGSLVLLWLIMLFRGLNLVQKT